MNSIIIGSDSFIGKYLLKKLEKYEHRVFSIKNCENIERIEEILHNNKIDWLFILSAQDSVKKTWENPNETVNLNIKRTLSILDIIKILDHKPKVLIESSAEIYGSVLHSQLPINEDTVQNPTTIYAATMACQEMLSKIYADAYKLNIVFARVFSVIGKGQSNKFMVSNFIHQVILMQEATRKENLKVGNLNTYRDFIDVQDVVEAFILLMKKNIETGIYNIGSGIATSTKQVIEIIKKEAGQNFDIELELKRFRPIDIPILQADITKIKENTGWIPKISLIETINSMVNYKGDEK